MYVGRIGFLTSSQPVGLFLSAILFFLHNIHPLDGETVLGRETEDFDFDGLPGSIHEFKVAVAGGSEQCFYQPIADGTSFFVRFTVLKGGDKKVDFYVKDHTGQLFSEQMALSTGYYRLDGASRAVMAVCVDNIYTNFGYKLIHMSILSVVVSHWQEFQKEIQEVNLVAENFTTSLTSVQSSITAMIQSQVEARFNVAKDYYLVMGNNYYVFVWSLGQCVLIVVASVVQVFSVRRLFKTSNVTPTTSKPRA